mgnify:FL=1
MSMNDLEGEWNVANVHGTRIGTATVIVDGGCSTHPARIRFHDLRTKLHTKFRLVSDPDPVMCCGFPDDVPPAPAGRPPAMVNADYEQYGTFWRCTGSPEEGKVVWTKTVTHVLDPNLGWMQSWDADDEEMGPKGAMAWTRPRKRGRPPSKKTIAQPAKQSVARTKAGLAQLQKKRRR